MPSNCGWMRREETRVKSMLFIFPGAMCTSTTGNRGPRVDM
jgi:hypothetical protein